MKDLIPITNEVTMTSVEVAELISQFKAMEGKGKLQHKEFLRNIRKELDTLEKLGLRNERNFALISYTDSRNRQKDCYEMNRDDILLMLNRESTFVRVKTIEYINALENKVQHQALLQTVQFQQTQIQELQKLIGLRSKRTFDYVKYIKDCLGIKKINEEYKRVKQRLFYEFEVTKFEELTYSDEVISRIEDIVRQVKQPTLYREGTQIAKVFNEFIENLNK